MDKRKFTSAANLENKHCNNVVTKLTRELLKNQHNVEVEVDNTKEDLKHSRIVLNFQENYNILEDLYLVRRYFSYVEKLNTRKFELLLYLYPKKIFSYHDYRMGSHDYETRLIVTMVKQGYVKQWEYNKRYRKDTRKLYVLTDKAKDIVVRCYQYLSREKAIPIDMVDAQFKLLQPLNPYQQKIHRLLRDFANIDPKPKYPTRVSSVV